MSCLVPSSSPQQFNITTQSPTAVQLSWLPPPPPDINGIILYYNLSFVEVGTGTLTWNIVTTTTTVIKNLHSFYTYKFTITAVTIIGAGPVTSAIIQLPESGKIIIIEKINFPLKSISIFYSHSSLISSN